MYMHVQHRLLGLREGSKLGFWRNLVGQGEKWQLLKAASSSASTATARGYDSGGIANNLHNNSSSSRWSCEESGSRGKYVRVGDSILIQTYRSDHLLSLNETLHAVEPNLVYRDRATILLGSEVWQVEQFDSIGLPTWYHSRPYLNGQFLVLPTAAKQPTPDAKSRTFPQSCAALAVQESKHEEYGSGSSSSEGNNNNNNIIAPPLHHLSLSTQHYLLIRDLLLTLSGIEGQYIRIAAAIRSSSSSSSSSSLSTPLQTREGMLQASPFKLNRTVPGMKAYSSMMTMTMTMKPSISSITPKLAEASFIIDLDCADRSTSNQVLLYDVWTKRRACSMIVSLSVSIY